MNSTGRDHSHLVYSDQDEEHFRKWLARLEDSLKFESSAIAEEEFRSEHSSTDADVEDGSNSRGGCGGSRNGSSHADVIKLIKSTIDAETASYPSWIALQKNLPCGRLASSSLEVKNYLRHIALPHVIESYQRTAEELRHSIQQHQPEDNVGNSMTSDDGEEQAYRIPLHLQPVVALDESCKPCLQPFMNSIRTGSNDATLGLCTLADINHRVNRAVTHDKQQVESWIANESQRLCASQGALINRREKASQLGGNHQFTVLGTSLTRLNSHVSALRDQVTAAEEAEEEARQAYEKAKELRREAEEAVNELTSFIDTTLSRQQLLLKKVTDLRLEIDAYNVSSARLRIDMFSGVKNYVHNLEGTLLRKRMAVDVPALFESFASMQEGIIEQYKKQLSGVKNEERQSEVAAAEQCASLQCTLRIGLETIRIWQQLNARGLSYLAVPIMNFESLLRGHLNDIESLSIAVREKEETDRTTCQGRNNTTVVLYFDHLQHKTPAAHFEAQARVATALDMIVRRLQDEERSESEPFQSNGVDADKRDEYVTVQTVDSNMIEYEKDAGEKEGVAIARTLQHHSNGRRKLELVNCNDIVSPPIWCLPLVHSPQYLLHLWQLAEEAHSGKLFVPLEFDTEWVSEDPYHASSEDEDFSLSRASRINSNGSIPLASKNNAMQLGNKGHLLNRIALAEGWGDALGESLKQQFLDLLTPSVGDHLIAKVLKRIESKFARSSKGSNVVGDKKSKMLKKNSVDDNSSMKSRALATVAVKTPYGSGTIRHLDQSLVANPQKSTVVVPVELDWGATGYFNPHFVQLIGNSNSRNDHRNHRHVADSAYRSEAQRRFIANTTGKYHHTNLDMHNYLCRLVNLTGKQRTVADFIGIIQGSLSVYLNGRASARLSKTIESNTKEYLAGFDGDALDQLLNEFESAEEQGKPSSPDQFLRKLDEIRNEDSKKHTVHNERGKSSREKSKRTEFRFTGSPLISTSASPRAAAVAAAVGIAASLSGSSNQINNSLLSLPMKERKSIKENSVGDWDGSKSKKVSRNNKSTATAPSSRTSEAHPKTLGKLVDISEQFRQSEKDPLPSEDYSRVPYRSPASKTEETSRGAGFMDVVSDNHATQGTTAAPCSPPRMINEVEPSPSIATTMTLKPAKREEASNALVASEVSACVSAKSTPSGGLYRQPSFAINDEIRSSVRYTKDGERLRKLLLGVITSLRMSFSSLANDYYRCFLYEITAGGVVAWFHFRGNKTNFQQMNQCALFWLEERKQHLSEMQMRLLEKLNNRIGTEVSPEYDSCDEDAPVSAEIIESPMRKNLRQIDQSNSACVEDKVGTESSNVFDESRRKDDSLLNSSDCRDAFSEVRGITKEIVQHALKANGFSGEKDEEVNLCAEQTEIQSASSVQRSREEKMDIENEKRTTSENHNLLLESATKAVDTHATTDDMQPNGATPRALNTINDLLSALVYEMNRRRVSQARVATEAKLRNLGMGQPALSKFLSLASLNDNERGRKFALWIMRWLRYSWKQIAAEGWSPDSSQRFGIEATGASSQETKTESIATNTLTNKNEVQDSLEDDLSGIQAADGIVNDICSTTSCEKCGKAANEFASHNEFITHVVDCNEEATFLRNRKRKHIEPVLYQHTAKKAKSTNSSEAERSSAAHVDGITLIQADKFADDEHYESCEVCKGVGDVILCDSCPCIYHKHCTDISDGKIPDGAWFCMRCRESGVDSAPVMALRGSELVGQWIYVFSHHLHRWRTAKVLAVHGTTKGLYVVKWWRKGGRSGKTNWLDISNAVILQAQPERSEDITATKSTTNSTDNKMEGVRFDSTVKMNNPNNERIPPSRSSRLKDLAARGLEHIDGAESGAVPPLVRTAATGIGGISALRGPEYSTYQDEDLNVMGTGKSDTYLSPSSLKAALCAAGTACRAVDIVMQSSNTNVFACTRPPGHHAGRYGCTSGCLSTGFCLLNNAAIAAVYGRVRWNLKRFAVVDIDVHFGNGTAELLRNDPNAFFASVHMIYGEDNNGLRPQKEEGASNELSVKIEDSTEMRDLQKRRFRASNSDGFYPALMGRTEIEDNYVSIGVYPADVRPTEDDEETTGAEAVYIEHAGAEGFLRGIRDSIIPNMERFAPQILIISAGFDGYTSDPLGGQLKLSLEDYSKATDMLISSMERISNRTGQPCRVISILEGGYDTKPNTLGLAKCVDAHVESLRCCR